MNARAVASLVLKLTGICLFVQRLPDFFMVSSQLLLILPGKKAYSLRDIFINSAASFVSATEASYPAKEESFRKSEIARKYWVN